MLGKHRFGQGATALSNFPTVDQTQMSRETPSPSRSGDREWLESVKFLQIPAFADHDMPHEPTQGPKWQYHAEAGFQGSYASSDDV